MTDKDEIVVKALKPTRRELLDYIHFGIDLYKDNLKTPYFPDGPSKK